MKGPPIAQLTPSDEQPPAALAVHERSYPAEALLHRHSYYQVLFPHRGAMRLNIVGERITVGLAHWALLPAGIEHVFWADEPNSFLVVDLATPVMRAHAELAAAAVPTDLALRRMDGRLAALATLLQSERRAGSLAEPLLAEALARYVTAAVLLAAAPGRPIDEPLAPSQRLAARVRDYLEQSALGPLGLEQVAAAAGASVAHVQRSFRAAYGLTVIEFVQLLRVRRAQALLRETDMPVEAVAAAVGFASASYFTRLFTRLTGAGPARFRAGR
jgi:AraC-like DNA-binding protein